MWGQGGLSDKVIFKPVSEEWVRVNQGTSRVNVFCKETICVISKAGKNWCIWENGRSEHSENLFYINTELKNLIKTSFICKSSNVLQGLNHLEKQYLHCGPLWALGFLWNDLDSGLEVWLRIHKAEGPEVSENEGQVRTRSRGLGLKVSLNFTTSAMVCDFEEF